MSRVIALVKHMSPDQRDAVRSRVATVVEQLTGVLDEMIAALDQIDGDDSLEANGDELDASFPNGGFRAMQHPCEDAEPSLGWTTTLNQAGNRGLSDCNDLEDDADKEPSLGALERHPSGGFFGGNDRLASDQTRWGAGRTDDLEEQCEGGGGDDDVRDNPIEPTPIEAQLLLDHHQRGGF